MDDKLIQEELSAIKEQLEYNTKLLETIISEKKPCNEDDSKEVMAKLFADLKKTPLGTHPAFAEMFGPLEKMFGNK